MLYTLKEAWAVMPVFQEIFKRECLFRLSFGPAYQTWQENGGDNSLNDLIRIQEPRFCYKLN